ncbi:baseplate J/gp47 family protein [Kribbella sp. NPDC055110]
MPLFPPVTDTLRWEELVHHGRAQLPLVSPTWTDQNTSDVGIALLELLAFLVETDSYRSGAVTDRQRRRLLALVGYDPLPARPATALVGLSGTGRFVVPHGFVLLGAREEGVVPLTLLDDVAVTGATVAVAASAVAAAADDDYRVGCADLSRDLTARRPAQPFGPEPAVGDTFLVGLDCAGGLSAGPVDLWIMTSPGLSQPEADGTGSHHDVTTEWQAYDGATWQPVLGPDLADDTAALTRSGHVRLVLPPLPTSTLGDQVAGCLAGRSVVWLRSRITSGRHDAAPIISAVHVDVGRVIAAHPFDTALTPPAGLGPDLADLGSATGAPGETFVLPQPWCDRVPALWVVDPDGTTHSVRIVADPALATPHDYAAYLDPDGREVQFGDGRCGRTLAAGATVLAAGTWTTDLGVGSVLPPLRVEVPADGRTQTLLGPNAAGTHARLIDSLTVGAPAEDLLHTAARAEQALWVHDRLSEALSYRKATSLDELGLEEVRGLPVPERVVTAADLERRTLATPGTALWRARALPEVDPRLPGMRADGCVTVVVVPSLPVQEPRPTAGLLRRIRADLAPVRTLGTRVFVVGPEYVRVGVRATLVLLPGTAPREVVRRAEAAVAAFLHPVTGGPSGRGWPFGRAVRRSEVLQLLDGVAGVDRVDDLTLSRGTSAGDCGDVTLRPTQLVLAGHLELSAVSGRWS